jgi:hypothetical protein
LKGYRPMMDTYLKSDMDKVLSSVQELPRRTPLQRDGTTKTSIFVTRGLENA